MGKANFSDDFKRDAVAQITERGYPVAEVSQRLGVSQHSLYEWKKKFSQPSDGDDKDAEIRRLKRELTRVTEERDILKKATVGSTVQRNIIDIMMRWGIHNGAHWKTWTIRRTEAGALEPLEGRPVAE